MHGARRCRYVDTLLIFLDPKGRVYKKNDSLSADATELLGMRTVLVGTLRANMDWGGEGFGCGYEYHGYGQPVPMPFLNVIGFEPSMRARNTNPKAVAANPEISKRFASRSVNIQCVLRARPSRLVLIKLIRSR